MRHKASTRPSLHAKAMPTWLLAAIVLSACGGGGGDAASPVDTGIPASATTVLVSSQASAEALVRDAEQRTRDMRLAGGLAGSVQPGVTPGSLVGAGVTALGQRRKALAVQDVSADLCSAGSANVDVPDALLQRFAASPNASLLAGDSIGVAARNCIIKAPFDLGDVGIGNFGVGATIDGRFALLLKSRNGADHLFSLTYTDFRYAPAGTVAYDPLTAVLQFGSTAGVPVFALDLADTRFLDAPQVSTAGTAITVDSGSLRTKVPVIAGGGWADYAFRSWAFDPGAQRASAGSVSVGGAAQTRALIGASPAGYTVDVTVGGTTTRHLVSR